MRLGMRMFDDFPSLTVELQRDIISVNFPSMGQLF